MAAGIKLILLSHQQSLKIEYTFIKLQVVVDEYLVLGSKMVEFEGHLRFLNLGLSGLLLQLQLAGLELGYPLFEVAGLGSLGEFPGVS